MFGGDVVDEDATEAEAEAVAGVVDNAAADGVACAAVVFANAAALAAACA